MFVRHPIVEEVADAFHITGRDCVTARVIFSRRQIFAIVIFSIPRRAERILSDLEIIELSFAFEYTDEPVVRIVNPETECAVERRRKKTYANRFGRRRRLRESGKRA